MSDDEGKQQAEEGPATSSLEPPEPVPSTPIAPREDQIQNAVTFLSHPKVRGSSVDSKRSFLQKKGLTEAEIAESFKRVPETSDTTVAAPASSTTGQLAQISRPQKPFPTATSSGQAYGHSQALQPQQALQPAGYRWSQVALGAGLVAVTFWGVRRMVLPYATQWYRSWIGKPDMSKREEQSQIATILADAIKAQTAELRSSVDSMKEMLKKYERGRSGSDSKDSITLPELRQELRSFASTLNDFRPAPSGSSTAQVPEAFQRQLTEIKSMLARMHASQGSPHGNSHPASPSAGDAASVSRQLPFGSSGPQMNPTAATDRGSPVSLQSGSTSPQAQQQLLPSPFENGGSPDRALEVHGGSPDHALEVDSSPEGPPHPSNYMEILDMLQRGQEIPGIKQINDKPPNPAQAIGEGKLKPRPKPWELASQNGGLPAAPKSFFSNTAGSSANGNYAGSNGKLLAAPGGSSNSVEITEVANTPDQGHSRTANGSPASGTSAPWRPPPVPQSSMNLGKQIKAESSSST